MDEYYRAIRLLPAWLAQPLARLPQNTAEKVHELRLRTGCGICLSIAGQQTTLDELPECPQTLRGRTLDALQMDEILYVLCGGSVHTHQAELAQGYLTTASGCRVGVGGRFVLRGPEDVVLQRLLSLNFRIARPICTELPAELCTLLQGHFIGALLVGEPDSGKTTLLRQIARELAAQKRAVAAIDERGELFPPERQNGDALDCISGLPKGRAVQMALRTLAPQVILLDELGDLTEVAALEQGFFSGVEFCGQRPCRHAGGRSAKAAGEGFTAAGSTAVSCPAGRTLCTGPDPGDPAASAAMMLHILGALLLPLCGWLAGDAIQARAVQHLAALQKCLALLERIRQEVAFRRADLQQLYAELCREGILESGARCLQEAPPPEGLTREEQQCFRTCMSGLGRAEAQQECEQLDYYRARLQALQQTAEHAARRQAGLPRKLGLAAGMAMALLLI